MKIKTVVDVALWRLCVGCGACAYICPEGNINLINVINEGIRPIHDPTKCRQCGQCLKVCPGYETDKTRFQDKIGGIKGLRKSWGNVLEIWEGYATDPQIRYLSASGGLTSALALYGLEKENIYGVLQTSTDEKNPLFNETILSQGRKDILASTGSRYSPSSPCRNLNLIESTPNPCIFIGKPCDIAALHMLMAMRPNLSQKIALTIGIFCAGTPSWKGTLDLLAKMNVNPHDLNSLRYRGKGWPGRFIAESKNGKNGTVALSYKEAWGFLQAYRPYRCYLCPDSTAELADISCGDPWYRQIQDEDMGYSLVLIRTERGRAFFQRACESGYVRLFQADESILKSSQKEMPQKRGAIYGRLLTMRAFGMPIPKFRGYFLFRNWLGIPFKEKARSIFGTARRILKRKYYRRQNHFVP